MKPIKCAIVGLGRIGSTLEDDSLREKPASHAGAIAANPECTLVAGCDIDKEKRTLFSRRWHCRNLFKNIDEMLAVIVPHILCIATPPETHKDLVLKATAAGVPLVVCEKPLTEDRAEAEEIIRTTDRSATILMVNHERRYSLDYRHCREIIQKQVYGDVLSLTCKLYMAQGRNVEEMLWEDGTHMIDIIRFLTQKKDSKLQESETEVSDLQVTGNLFSPGGEAIIIFRLGTIYVIIDAACNRDHLVFEIDLSFSGGMIKIGNGVYEEYASGTSQYYENFKSLIKKETDIFAKTNYFSNMLADAVRIVQADNNEQNRNSMSNLESADLSISTRGSVTTDRPVSTTIRVDTGKLVLNATPVSTGKDGYYAVKIISDIVEKAKK